MEISAIFIHELVRPLQLLYLEIHQHDGENRREAVLSVANLQCLADVP